MAENLNIQFNKHSLSNYYVLVSLLHLVKLANQCRHKERCENLGHLRHFDNALTEDIFHIIWLTHSYDK